MITVYDTSVPGSLASLEQSWLSILPLVAPLAHIHLVGVQVRPGDRVANPPDAAEKVARAGRLPFTEVSVASGAGINDLFTLVIEDCMRRALELRSVRSAKCHVATLTCYV